MAADAGFMDVATPDILPLKVEFGCAFAHGHCGRSTDAVHGIWLMRIARRGSVDDYAIEVLISPALFTEHIRLPSSHASRPLSWWRQVSPAEIEDRGMR